MKKFILSALDLLPNTISANSPIFRLYQLFQKTTIAYLISFFLKKLSRTKNQKICSKAYSGASLLFVIPSVAFAQVLGPLGATVSVLQSVVDFLIPLLMALAVLVFLWGLVRFIANATDEAAKESGKALMIWGMVGLFVMIAFWGLIGYMQESLGLSGVIVSDPPPTLTFGS